MTNQCPKSVKNETRIDGLNSSMDAVMKWMRRLEEKIDHALATALKRPGWTVCIIITFLTSTCVALLIALLNRL